MSGVNKVILVGNLGANPVLSKVGDDTVCNFSIATSEFNGVGKEKHTEWHECAAWNKDAERMLKCCQAGTIIYIEGAIRTKTVTKEGELARKFVKIRISKMEFVAKLKPKEDQ